MQKPQGFVKSHLPVIRANNYECEWCSGRDLNSRAPLSQTGLPTSKARRASILSGSIEMTGLDDRSTSIHSLSSSNKPTSNLYESFKLAWRRGQDIRLERILLSDLLITFEPVAHIETMCVTDGLTARCSTWLSYPGAYIKNRLAMWIADYCRNCIQY